MSPSIQTDEQEPTTTQQSERDQFSRDLFTQQYSTLRSEIEKRLDMRQSLLTFTLVIAGTSLSIGVQPAVAAVTIFSYPCIALFLAAAWTHNDTKIGQISHFIRTEIEPHMAPFTPWESHRRRVRTMGNQMHLPSSRSSLIDFSTKGIFLVTELLALLVGSIRSVTSLMAEPTLAMVVTTSVLFLLSLAASIWSYTLLQHHRN